MKRMTYWILAWSLILLVGCDSDPKSEEPEQPQTTITGVVIDAETRAAMPSVSISTEPPTEKVITDDGGRFVIDVNVEVGKRYRINAFVAGYAPNGAEVTIIEGQNTTADIVLSKTNAILDVTPTTLDFEENKDSQTITIKNEGTDSEFTWTLKVPDERWVTADKTTGVISDNAEAVNVNVDRTGLCNGSHETTLTITTDNNAGTETVDIHMTVTGANCTNNTPPSASFTVTPPNGDTQTTFVMDASNSMDNEDLTSALKVRWQWNTGDDFTEWMTAKTVSHRYNTPGTKTLSLEVQDTQGLAGSTTETVTVTESTNQAPTASFTLSPENGNTQTVFMGDASGSTDEDPTSVLEVRWRWADGEPFTPWTTVKTASRQYNMPGTKTITLEVKDTQAAIGSLSKTIFVQPEGTSSVETEPNDDAQQANEITISSSIGGTIGEGEDAADWYRVEMPSNGTFQYQITNLHVAGVSNGRVGSVELYDASLQEIGDLGDTTPTEMDATARISVSGETYFLKVNQYSSSHAAPYRLETSFISTAQHTDLGEPNDVRSQAHTISENETLEALIGYSGDAEDWYQIAMPSNGTFQFQVTNLHDPDVSYGDVGDVELYDASLMRVTSTSRLQEGQNTSSIQLPVTGGETYYLKVKQYTIHSTPYRLQTLFTATTAVTDVGEPNASSNQAHAIPETGSLEALIGYGSDTEDWYRLTIPSNGTLQYTVTNLHISGVSNGRVGPVELYNASLQEVADISGGSRLDPTENQTSSQVTVAGGAVYYIKVNQHFALHAAPGNLHDPDVTYGDVGDVELYDISLTRVTLTSRLQEGQNTSSIQLPVTGGETYYLKVKQYTIHSTPYRLQTLFTATTAVTDVGEPNASSNQAHAIPETGSLEALIGYGSDTEDWYRLTIPSNGTLQYTVTNLHISGVSNGRVGPVELYNASLQEVADISGGSRLDPTENQTSSQVTVAGGAVYYIKVNQYSALHAAPYRLETTFTAD